MMPARKKSPAENLGTMIHKLNELVESIEKHYKEVDRGSVFVVRGYIAQYHELVKEIDEKMLEENQKTKFEKIKNRFSASDNLIQKTNNVSLAHIKTVDKIRKDIREKLIEIAQTKDAYMQNKKKELLTLFQTQRKNLQDLINRLGTDQDTASYVTELITIAQEVNACTERLQHEKVRESNLVAKPSALDVKLISDFDEILNVFEIEEKRLKAKYKYGNLVLIEYTLLISKLNVAKDNYISRHQNPTKFKNEWIKAIKDAKRQVNTHRDNVVKRFIGDVVNTVLSFLQDFFSTKENREYKIKRAKFFDNQPFRETRSAKALYDLKIRLDKLVDTLPEPDASSEKRSAPGSRGSK